MSGLTPWQYAERTRNEYAEQVALFMWANMAARYGISTAKHIEAYTIAGWAENHTNENFGAANMRPECLKYMFAIKNAGHGDAIRGAMSKAEGVKLGVPDICLPLPIQYGDWRNGFAGLYIELKRLKSARGAAGKVSADQSNYHKYLTDVGYKVETCVGWEAARDAIISYLGY